jgi:hypothetical protein
MKTFTVFAIAALGVLPLSAATWTGKISDSMCGASHAKMSASHGGASDKDCTLACVKGGGKYVFVSEGKVYQISNQKAKGLQDHAGADAKITGTMKGDSITVSKIE